MKPAPLSPEELSSRLTAALKQRMASGEVFPPLTLQTLLMDVAPGATLAEVILAVRRSPFSREALLAVGYQARRFSLEVPVVSRGDSQAFAASDQVLAFALGLIRTEKTHLVTPGAMGEKLASALQAPFRHALAQRLERDELPAGMAWLYERGVRKLFLREDIHPRETTPPPQKGADFATAFRQVFKQLDARNGKTNFVSLVELRRELGQFSRQEFDDGLRQLRRERRFAMAAAESKCPSDEVERQAGFQEGDTFLLYVMRKDS